MGWRVAIKSRWAGNGGTFVPFLKKATPFDGGRQLRKITKKTPGKTVWAGGRGPFFPKRVRVGALCGARFFSFPGAERGDLLPKRDKGAFQKIFPPANPPGQIRFSAQTLLANLGGGERTPQTGGADLLVALATGGNSSQRVQNGGGRCPTPWGKFGRPRGGAVKGGILGGGTGTPVGAISSIQTGDPALINFSAPGTRGSRCLLGKISVLGIGGLGWGALFGRGGDLGTAEYSKQNNRGLGHGKEAGEGELRVAAFPRGNGGAKPDRGACVNKKNPCANTSGTRGRGPGCGPHPGGGGRSKENRFQKYCPLKKKVVLAGGGGGTKKKKTNQTKFVFSRRFEICSRCTGPTRFFPHSLGI